MMAAKMKKKSKTFKHSAKDVLSSLAMSWKSAQLLLLSGYL